MIIRATEVKKNNLLNFFNQLKNQTNLIIEIDSIDADCLTLLLQKDILREAINLSIRKIHYSNKFESRYLNTYFVHFLINNHVLCDCSAPDIKLTAENLYVLSIYLKNNLVLKKLNVNVSGMQNDLDEMNAAIERNQELYLIIYLMTQEVLSEIKKFYSNSHFLEIEKKLKEDKRSSFNFLYNTVNELHQKILADDDKLIDCLNLLSEFIAVIDTFSACCLEGVSPITILSTMNLPDYLQKLIEQGANITKKSTTDLSPLQSAMQCAAIDNLKYLLINHRNRLQDEISKPPFLIHAAMLNNNELSKLIAEKFILNYKKEDIIQARRLFYVLGGKKINDAANTENTIFNGEGGNHDDAIDTLIMYLERFSRKPLSDSTRVIIDQLITLFKNEIDTTVDLPCRTLIELLENSYANRVGEVKKIVDFLKNGKQGSEKIVHSGFFRHYIPCYIKKKNDHQYILVIADKGPLRREQTRLNKDKHFNLNQLIFSEDHLEEVIQLLCITKETHQKRAAEIIFEEIPKITNAEYKNLAIEQSMYKAGICYFSNFKSIIYYRLVDALGSVEGKKIYKNFDLFIRSNVVNDSIKYFGSENVYIQCGKKIMDEKKQKHASLLLPSLFCDNENEMNNILKKQENRSPSNQNSPQLFKPIS